MEIDWLVSDSRIQLSEGLQVGEMKKGVTWAIRKRLEFIEFLLYWEGKFWRKDFELYFSIAAPTVTADLDLYDEVTTRRGSNGEISNVKPREKGKPVEAKADFVPRLIEPDFDDYMSFYEGPWRAPWRSRVKPREAVRLERSSANKIVRVATIQRRTVDPEVVRKLLRAIERKGPLTVEHLAPNYKQPESITISPRYLGHDGFRWHVRAFVKHDATWRDIVVDRIRKANEINSDGDTSGKIIDDPGSKDVTISVVPHPGLSDHHKQNIAAQYPRLKGGRWAGTMEMKRSFVPYFLKKYQIEEESLRKEPHQQPLTLVDREAVTLLIDPDMRVPPRSRHDPLSPLIKKARAQLGSLKTANDLEIVVEALTRLVKQRA